jgi:hypothetical protein
MLSLLKKIFGATPTEASPAPYKVEAPTPVAETTPVATPKKSAKKPAVKKATGRKPKAPKA